ncbi:hypothetical protein, partial [Xanthovirga aplysinae]|uniref:hypothetical protein n=1 Tax=Xanthovirga aplysinae TaxID=2529853 RepID=UPI00165730AB
SYQLRFEEIKNAASRKIAKQYVYYCKQNQKAMKRTARNLQLDFRVLQQFFESLGKTPPENWENGLKTFKQYLKRKKRSENTIQDYHNRIIRIMGLFYPKTAMMKGKATEGVTLSMAA